MKPNNRRAREAEVQAELEALQSRLQKEEGRFRLSRLLMVAESKGITGGRALIGFLKSAAKNGWYQHE